MRRKGTRLYSIWKNIKTRCYNQNACNYCYYGGRGIVVCDEWKRDFSAFYDWAMKHGYNDSLSIDRINNDGMYSPDNCRWVSNDVQQANKRNNHYVTINGITKSLTEWSRIYHIDSRAVNRRVNASHWDPVKALTTPVKQIKKNELFFYDGKYATLKQWAKELNINYQTLYGRIYHYGWPIDKALCIGEI